MQLLTLFFYTSLLFAAPFTPSLLGEPTDPEPATISPSTPGAVYFTPPPGWRLADEASLPKGFLLMVVGEGKSGIRPSLTLSTESYKGSLKDYVKLIKAINAKKGVIWSDLGKIKTPAGEGSLSQMESKIQGEDIRQMHAIFEKNGMIYILAAAAPKEEFSTFYKTFFDAMSSLHINDDLGDP